MIVRVAAYDRYTQVRRRTIDDNRLSWKARGLLVWLLDKPDNWHIEREGIANAGPDGEHAVRSALRELSECGYLRRTRVRHPDGTFHTESVLYESPPDPSPLDGFPPADNPPADNRPAEASKTQESKTEKSKDVEGVFQTWKQSTSRGEQTVLDDKRSRLILKALKDYPLPDVLDAVRGWERSAWHTGANDAGKVYNDLSLLLRDADHIEQFRDLYRKGGAKPARKVRVDADGVPLDPNSHEAMFGVRPPTESNGHG